MKKHTMRISLCCLAMAGLFSFSFVSCGGADKKKGDGDSTKTDTTAKTTEVKGDLAGAKAIVTEFLKKDADCKALTKKLIPTMEDCKAYFIKEEDAKRANDYMQEALQKMDKENKFIEPKEGQNDYLIFSATTDEMKVKEWKGALFEHFPGGYRDVAPILKPGITVYLFKFVKKGEDKGVRYDGLIFVNKHWVIFPKIWRAFKEKMNPKVK